MPKTLKLLLVAGARPNFMKVAPLIREIKRRQSQASSSGIALSYRLVHTGQHYDQAMSEVFFQELSIPAPDVNLEVGSGSHAAQTAQVMLKFEPVCLREKPDWVVVVGDVNSTLACTLVATKLGVKLAHVEAGLRSFDRTMPEELNRLATDALADLLLTPSSDADENLRREGVEEAKIRCVGNIMIDALMANLPQARSSHILTRLGLTPRSFAYVTLHRPANVDNRDSLAHAIEALNKLSDRMPVVFPIHPRTRKMLEEFGLAPRAHAGFKILDPIGYHDSLALTEQARLVLTDSGGLQEETTFFQTPCLTMRPNTERPVTVSMGSNRLTAPERLWPDFESVLAREDRAGKIPPLWDGQTAGRILRELSDDR